jgi:hypothetical protein
MLAIDRLEALDRSGRRGGEELRDILEGGRAVGLERQEGIAAAFEDFRGDRRPGANGVPMALIVTSAPVSASRSSSSGIAAISFDLPATASCPNTSRCRLAQADTRCNGSRPVLRACVRRDFLPLMAITSGAITSGAMTSGARQRHFDKIVGPHQRCAESRQNDLRQRIEHLRRLPRVVHRRRLIKQRASKRLIHRAASSVAVLHESQDYLSRNPKPDAPDCPQLPSGADCRAVSLAVHGSLRICPTKADRSDIVAVARSQWYRDDERSARGSA